MVGKFNIGDKVIMPGVPLPAVEVLDIKQCEDPGCPFEEQEVFQFADPATGDLDWMHTAEFELGHGWPIAGQGG